jgi:flavin-dependent dehydrogenase
MKLALSGGSRVCIVGGGPAGSLSALHLLDLAAGENLDLHVQIFEPRDFSAPGPGGCNRCAGVLSSGLLEGLAELGLEVPPGVVQATLRSYAMQLEGDLIPIHQPDPRRRIVSVYRGGGPRLVQPGPLASFDEFLLNEAVRRGAVRTRARVRKITWQDGPLLHLARERLRADLLVLATGVNSRSPLEAGFGYRPPTTAVMAQDEILRPPDWPPDQVRAFFHKPKGLTFGALIPKGQYLNISLLGKRLATDAVSDFMEAQGLSPGLPLPPGSLCGCTPRVAVSPARGFFGDGWVAVGDAAVTRLYKDGIGSAYATAKAAMRTAMYRGITAQAFRGGYLPTCRGVANDNRYGTLLFRLWSLTLGSARMLRAWKGALEAEAGEPPERQIHIRVLWGMLTGDEPYRDLFFLLLGNRSLRGLWEGFRNPAA